MDLQDAGCLARFLIRNRDGKFSSLLDAVLANVGIAVVLTGVRMPRMNTIMERWVQTCRCELLDRTLIWNERHLLYVPPPPQVERRAATAGPRAAHRTKPTRSASHPPTRPTRRHLPRVPPCRLTCIDGVFGKRNVDNYWRDLGTAAGCLTYLPDAIVEHLHPSAGKAALDEGYGRVNAPEM